MRPASIREGLSLGVVAALVWAMPAALRTGHPALCFVVLAGTGVLLLAPLVAFGRVALADAPAAASALARAVGLSVVPLAALAYGLGVLTHHRGLGGATFGLLGGATVAGALVVVRLCDRARPPVRVWLERALALLGAAGVLAVAGAAAALGSRAVRLGLADAGVGIVAVALVVRMADRAPEPVRRWGWLGVPILGAGAVALLAASPQLAADLGESAPVVFGTALVLAP